jgi:hypothetical protein
MRNAACGRPLITTILLVLVAARAGTDELVVPPHRFWDTANVALFAGVGASRALDYASTRHFRRRGANEILLNNRIVDDKPLFIGIEAAGTVLQIGACAWLHAHDHHKTERWISVVHIGVTTFGAARNYTLGRGVPPQ